MKKLFIANWKSAMSARDVARFLKEFKNPKPRAATVAIAPSSLHLSLLGKDVLKAAQDVSVHPLGAFTGDVSAVQLAELGVKYCLVGHSERRIYHAESEDDIFAKTERLLAARITPVLCVGERADQRAQGKTEEVLKSQLAVLADVSRPESVIIAYEPVWAISTFQKEGKAEKATDEQIIEAHRAIKGITRALVSQKASMTILYGGSVTPENSAEFLNAPEVGGVLVGAASMDAKKFAKIINNLK